MRIRFLTSTPLDISRGSGTYVGMHVLARALEALGHTVDFETPRLLLPVHTAQRLVFNQGLRPRPEYSLTVGFDMDGYRIAAEARHVASLKGVIADEARLESGMTRFTMGVQARCERLHARRAARVVVTSRYSAGRAREFYGLERAPAVVPELIDLGEWRKLLAEGRDRPHDRFRLLFVGRFYRRKRVDVLLRAAGALATRIPNLELRIVGNGPCAACWQALAGNLKLGGAVAWLGDVSRSQLVDEYRACDLFCLPSVQEGFGIVLLEAMAAGRAIVASRAAAIPEVVPHGLLVEPESPEALAAAIEELHQSPARRAELGRTGAQWVERFDAARVARLFLEAASGVATGLSV
ncbi:MAG: glycosyltransferase family 4 protein [Bryobacteraceae bacterium]